MRQTSKGAQQHSIFPVEQNPTSMPAVAWTAASMPECVQVCKACSMPVPCAARPSVPACTTHDTCHPHISPLQIHSMTLHLMQIYMETSSKIHNSIHIHILNMTKHAWPLAHVLPSCLSSTCTTHACMSGLMPSSFSTVSDLIRRYARNGVHSWLQSVHSTGAELEQAGCLPHKMTHGCCA